VIFGKSLDLDGFAAPLFFFRPFQCIHSTIWLGTSRIVYLTIVFECTVNVVKLAGYDIQYGVKKLKQRKRE
jgi:hypothetical protein